ncbi:MAG: hypothetical protein Q8934_20095 [Bacillota bacterium]|nr:hypothetical protein [Bacillota bacterium]
MIGLIISILIFNFVAFKTNNKLTKNKIVHIWLFTAAFQQAFDVFINFKYKGYWYFNKDIDFAGALPYFFLVPPVNIIFLNWYPFGSTLLKRISFIILWTIGILLYEAFTLLPKPIGFFHFGWWTFWIEAIVSPILLYILIRYYKWICTIEKEVIKNERCN